MAQDRQTAKTQSLGEFKLIAGDKAFAAQGLGDELPGMWRQGGDVAQGAGARAFWGAKGLADQISEVGVRAMFALGGLNEHTRYRIAAQRRHVKEYNIILLATFMAQKSFLLGFNQMQREVRLTP